MSCPNQLAGSWVLFHALKHFKATEESLTGRGEMTRLKKNSLLLQWVQANFLDFLHAWAKMARRTVSVHQDRCKAELPDRELAA